MAKVLVVGGAGYVGSATCAHLLDNGHFVWVLDDLSTGHRELALGHGFTLARAGDRERVSSLLKKHSFDCVMHFAAKSLVAESVLKPQEYFENNVEQTRILLETMLESQVQRFVFSSTCAIFGDVTVANPNAEFKIHEKLPKSPVNPYGETKLAVENMLENLAISRGLQAVALRYFNAAGAESKNRVGEWHNPETHLIPNILSAAINHKAIKVFGTDYPTSDGTCVRDYVHVTDLAQAHVSAMDRLCRKPKSEVCFEAFNLGSEHGYSVKEVVEKAAEVLGRAIQIEKQPRRAGDPPRLVADSTLAKRELGFSPQAHSLDEIIATAWKWEQKKMIPKKAVFLDRDGTINEDPGYLNHPDQLHLLPEAGEALGLLNQAGYQLIIVSNQSGVGRGLIDPKVLPQIHQKLDDLLQKNQVKILGYELCLHRPEDNCECRKPKPKLLSDAAKRLNIDLSQSYMIGDKLTDLGAGRAAGCKAVALVLTGYGKDEQTKMQPQDADFIGSSVLDVAKWIVGNA